VRVLESVEEPTEITNPYIVQLLDGLRSAGVRIEHFDWRSAFRGDYDLFHVHWPELVVRAPTAARRTAKQLLFLALILALRLRRVPIVWTVHNVAPHEGASLLQRIVLAVFTRSISAFILINAAAAPDVVAKSPGESHVILHGDYRDWFSRHEPGLVVRKRMLYFGLLRPYKGVESLLAAFADLDDPAATLHIAGKPIPATYGESLERLAAADERVTLSLGFATDEAIRRNAGEAELVVLPYRQMYNSGSALLALSLGRPVLVPNSPSNEALAAEVGNDWVIGYEGELDATILRGALASVSPLIGSTEPDLSARDWRGGIAKHLELFGSLTRR
jgi:beta-1,4-mannosyltransferase